MSNISQKIASEGLTYDDVLLIPNYSEVLPRTVNIQSRFSKNITLNVPIVSAAMDTVTNSDMAIAIAQEGGIGVLHKNMTISQQAQEVKRVKRAESVMIIDPVTLQLEATIEDAKNAMDLHRIANDSFLLFFPYCYPNLSHLTVFFIPSRNEIKELFFPNSF